MQSELRWIALLMLVVAVPSAGSQALDRRPRLVSAAQTIGSQDQINGSSGGAASQHDPVGPGCCTPLYQVFFTAAVRGAALEFSTDPGRPIFTALVAGSTMLSVRSTKDLPKQSAPLFDGFDSSIALDKIESQPAGQQPLALATLEARQSVVAIPEPASLVLLATGLAGLAAYARGRRRYAV